MPVTSPTLWPCVLWCSVFSPSMEMEIPVSTPPAEGGIQAEDAGKPAEEGGGLLEPLPLKHSKPEDLVARAIAPVKTEYLRPPPLRPPSNAEVRNHGGGVPADGGGEKATTPSAPMVVMEKKSKRQLKRERQQEQKSAKNICSEIAKTGDVGACRFGGSCRFSHDLDGFLAQKPADIPGVCPSLNIAESCPYGVACRLAGTHKEAVPSNSSDDAPPKKNNVEVNSLNKDFQKLLWKNKVKFPKADAQLKLLGLGGKNSKVKMEVAKDESHPTVLNGSTPFGDDSNKTTSYSVDDDIDVCLDNESLDVASVINHLRPPKRAKCPIDESCCSAEVNTGVKEKFSQIEQEETLPNTCPGSRVELIPKLNEREKKQIDFRGKLYLAPLTTVGNLPFRRVCKALGADITCGEMAMCTNILQGQASEWALLRRHSSEDIFGVQICGAYPDTVARTVELIDRECTVDFIDINMGCPIDIVVNKGAGSSLLTKPLRMKNVIQAASRTVDIPLTVKVRTGYFEGRNRIDSLIADIGQWGSSAITIHGRSRQQRYSKLADWDYIYQCARKAPNDLQVLGNGDIFSYVDWNKHTSDCPQLFSCMIARGALIKPWIFTEIKEQRHWDISSSERFDILKDFVNFGLEHWGSDNKGVETTRHFLLEWLSYTHRYVPAGLLEVVPQRLNWRPPSYFGRDELETLMASDSAADWIRISEMLLGKVPEGFTFAPKHKSNAYDRAENG